jgi:hypothetical protein
MRNVTILQLPEFSFSAELTIEERGESSSTRELLAIQRTLQHWAESDTIARPLEQVHTLAWEFSKKDIIGGKEIQFLVIKIGSVKRTTGTRVAIR